MRHGTQAWAEHVSSMKAWAERCGLVATHTPLTAVSFNCPAAYLGTFVNMSAHLSTLKVMYGGVLPMLKKTPFAITNNITGIQNAKPLEQ